MEEKIINPQVEEKVKKSFPKRFWWILIIGLILIGVIICICLNESNRKTEESKQSQKEKEAMELAKKQADENKNIQEGRKPPMTEAEISKAQEALATGISFDDANNDYAKVPAGVIQGDGRPDNSAPWPVPYTNLKKVQIGADETYLYVKYQFYGVFPTEMYRYNDDFLAGVGVNFNLQDYFNHNLNKKDSSALFQVGLTYAGKTDKDSDNGDLGSFYNPPILGTSTFGEANSAVKDKNGEDTYGIGTGEGKTFGGAGYDYVMAAFPLSNLGLRYGDTIKFDVSAESGSKVYHHQSIDPLLDFGSAKMGRLITWQIGSNSCTTEIPKI